MPSEMNEQDERHKIEKRSNGRDVILFEEDGVAFDAETYHNLFDNGACDTYVELPRMIKQTAKDIAEISPFDPDETDGGLTLTHSISHHVDGLKDIIFACEDAIKILTERAKQLGIPDEQVNPVNVRKFEIHGSNNFSKLLDGILKQNDQNNKRRF